MQSDSTPLEHNPQKTVDYDCIIFLDIDGVFNCDLHYKSEQFVNWRDAKKDLKKKVKKGVIDRLDYYRSQISIDRIVMFSELCKEINAAVVISSTWRMGKTIEELQEIMDSAGGYFKIISKTERLGYERGIEISKWLQDNIKPETHGVHYFDYHKYAIIDDDTDMLLDQQFNFFQTDSYSGFTYNTYRRIKKFITGQTFGNGHKS